MNSKRKNLPSIKALIAFERVAQLGNVTRAAEELFTSQSAISRHLRQLENKLGTSLVMRSGRNIVLTPAGQTYAQEVSKALTRLHQAGEYACVNRYELTIACTHEVSHLIIMPWYSELKTALGSKAHVRIITGEYWNTLAMIDAGADVIFQYRRSQPRLPCAFVAAEEVLPVASPEFKAKYKKTLSRGPHHWAGIPRLQLTKENSGWMTWDDWFKAQKADTAEAPQHNYDNYVYALEAATRGEGLVLAWRGFTDLYFQAKQLVPVHSGWLKSGTKLYAVATSQGIAKELTRKCIDALSNLAHEAKRVK